MGGRERVARARPSVAPSRSTSSPRGDQARHHGGQLVERKARHGGGQGGGRHERVFGVLGRAAREQRRSRSATTAATVPAANQRRSTTAAPRPAPAAMRPRRPAAAAGRPAPWSRARPRRRAPPARARPCRRRCRPRPARRRPGRPRRGRPPPEAAPATRRRRRRPARKASWAGRCRQRRGSGVEHRAAADGLPGRQRAQDEAIVRLDGGRAAVEPHDRHRLFARRELAPVEEAQVRDVLRGAVVQAHALAGLERPRGADQTHGGGERARRGEAGGRLGAHQKRAALDGRPVGAAQAERDTPPGEARLDGVVVHLHATHGHRLAAGLHDQPVAHADGAAPQRARDHRAEALQGEDAVDRQARRPLAAIARARRGDTAQARRAAPAGRCRRAR